MDDDFLVEMGYAGLTGRLKRLSDSFLYSTRQFYRDNGLEIEPNWHMIFLLLEKHERLTVMEIAEKLHLSHPAIVQLVDKMKKKGYINSVKDPKDKRKHLLRLSKKARLKLPEMQRHWDAGDKAVKEIMNHSKAIFDHLAILEKNIEQADFNERSKKYLNKTE
ncbi:MarR family winged helix-turn-helix transcriptional regulator [Zunongwangia sp. HGR-M22]|uniref:MarR family winged helix-turn-helix transcriptional regulator n=1 Tax=Zunongwangia sp. HGR-M22 TaxID=3015168 RepID=UPI0022DD4D94|nr:MarR family transcriptional regulator [Zunongwangia sp. HGR-M22]WBL26965.1 MarR family transcriptional regulator [Zunongwangia sp. HGR-M22]